MKWFMLHAIALNEKWARENSPNLVMAVSGVYFERRVESILINIVWIFESLIIVGIRTRFWYSRGVKALMLFPIRRNTGRSFEKEVETELMILDGWSINRSLFEFERHK